MFLPLGMVLQRSNDLVILTFIYSSRRYVAISDVIFQDIDSVECFGRLPALGRNIA